MRSMRGANLRPVRTAPDTEATDSPPEASDANAVNAGLDELQNLPDAPKARPISPDGSPAVAHDDDDLNDLPDAAGSLGHVYDKVYHGDPDNVAKVLDTSKKLGADPAQVAGSLKDAQRAANGPDQNFFKSIEDKYPGTTKFLSDPKNMAIAHDDLPNVAQHEDLVQKIKDAYSFEKNALNAGALQEELAFLRWQQLNGQTSPSMDSFRLGSAWANQMGAPTNDVLKRADWVQGKLDEINKSRPDEKSSWLKRGLYGATEFAPQIVSGMTSGLKYGAPAALGAAAAGWVTGPGELVITPTAFAVGFGTGEAEYNYKLMAGSAYDQLQKVRDDKGQPLPENVQKIASYAIGAAGVGLSLVKLGAVLESIPGGKEFLSKFTESTAPQVLNNPATRTQALKAFAKNYVTSVGHGTAAMTGLAATQVLGERGAEMASGQEFSHKDEPSIPAQIGNSAEDALLTFGVMGFPGSAIGLYGDMKQAQRARMAQDFYKALGDTAEDSKLRQRLPEAHQELIKEITKDGPVENIYVPQEAFTSYFQGKDVDPATVAKELGVEESFNEATKTGGDVKIPLDVWASRVAGTEHYQGLAGDIKFDPEDLTSNQVEERKAAIQKQIKEIEAQRESGQVSPGDSAAKIYDERYKQLTDAGMSPVEARQNAAIHEAAFRTLGQRTGVDPYELSKRFNLEVQRRQSMEQGEGKAFNQGEELKGIWRFPTDDEMAKDFNEDAKWSYNADGANEMTDQDFIDYVKKHGTVETITNEQAKRFDPLDSKTVADGEEGYKEGSKRILEGLRTGSKLPAIIAEKYVGKDGQPIYSPASGRHRSGHAIEAGHPIQVIAIPPIEEGMFKGKKFNQNAPTFYSNLERTLDKKMGGSATPQEIQGMIKDMKPEERKWSGIDEFLKGKKKVSKQDVMDFLRGNQLKIEEKQLGGHRGVSVEEGDDGRFYHHDYETGERLPGDGFDDETKAVKAIQKEKPAAKFSDYVLPGGENYREVLFTLPEKKNAETESKFQRLYDEHKEVSLKINAATKKIIEEGGRWNEARGLAVEQGLITQEDLDREKSLRHEVNLLGNKKQTESQDNFKSSHFDEPNVLAHTRLNDRVDSEGKRVLMIEEVQSDWHQAGRKKGYKDTSGAGDEKFKQLDSEDRDLMDKIKSLRKSVKTMDSLSKEMGFGGWHGDLTEAQKAEVNKAFDSQEVHKEIEKLEQRRADIAGEMNVIRDAQKTSVPDAPFKKTWHEFVLKRLIREAAEKGYDKIAWTTGEQQAERYDLSKRVREIEYIKDKKGNYHLSVTDHEGEGIDLPKNKFTADELDDVVGKEIAEKIRNEEGKHYRGHEGKTLEGVDLKVGGEGMKGFYDKMIPDFLRKFGKKFGATVGESKIEAGQYEKTARYERMSELQQDLDGYSMDSFKKDEKESDADRTILKHGDKTIIIKHYNGDKVTYIDHDSNGGAQNFASLEQFKKEAFGEKEDLTRYETVHSMEITPEMKKAALEEGFSLFQGEGEGPKGRITFKDTKAVVDLFKTADRSTFLHETGHYFLEMMNAISQDEKSPPQIKEDMQAIRDWLGLKPGEDFGVEHHEKFARGFEQYLREGNAPSDVLRRVFAKFKQWLVHIYKSARQLNVELSPEIRGVMDRMLATDEEIQNAQRQVGFEQNIEAPDHLKERMASLAEQARDKAESTLMREQMKEISEQNKKFLADESVRLKGEAEQKVAEEPVFKAQNDIQEAIGSRRKVLGLAEKMVNGSIKPEDAAHFEVAAEVNGFSSGEDLAQNILHAESEGLRKRLIEAHVEEGMRQHANLMDKLSIKADALKAIHNEHMTELLALERQILTQKVNDQTISHEVSRRNRIEARVAAAEAKEQAKQILDGKDIRDAGNFRVYTTAERHAAIKADAAMKRKDYAKAAEYKRQQMLNHALASEAFRNRSEVEASLRQLEKASKRDGDLKNMPVAFNKQIDQLLQRFGLKEREPSDQATMLEIAKTMQGKGESLDSIANATGMIIDPQSGSFRPETLRDFVQRVNENYHALQLPESVMNGQGVTDYKDLKMGDLRDLRDAVKAITKIGKAYDRFLNDFIKIDMKEAATRLKTSIEEIIGSPYAERRKIGSKYSSKWREKVENLKNIPDAMISTMVNTLTLCTYLDGGDINGPAHDYIYRPMKQAEDRKFARYAKMRTDLNELMGKFYDPKDLKGYKQRTIEFGDRKLSKEEVLAMALNWGNEQNRDRIRMGFGSRDGSGRLIPLSDEHIQGLFKHLDKNDWDFAQAAWDHLETYWPEVAALEMKVRGVEPERVIPAPFQNEHGAYRGGYYPLAYDFDKSNEAFKNEQQKTELYKSYSATSAQTEQGHTIARVSNVTRPVRLSLDVFFNHLENVVHDLEFRPAVIDVSKFLNMPDVKNALINGVGGDAYRGLESWLKGIASDQSENLTWLDKAVTWSRFGTTISALGLTPKAFLLHAPSNFFNAVWEIGVQRSVRMMTTAALDVAMGRGELKDFVFERSERMKQRLTVRDRDIMEMSKAWQGEAKGVIPHYAFMSLHLADEAVSIPLWAEIYKSNVAEFGEKKAAEIADETVTRTLGSGSKVDQIGFQRGSGVKKLFTMFYSWMSVMFNRAWLDGKMAGLEYKEGNVGSAVATMAKATFFAWLLPAVHEALLAQAMQNKPGAGYVPQTDEEKKKFIGAIIEHPFAMIPFVRDIAQPAIRMAMGEHAPDYKLSPVETSFQNLYTPLAHGMQIAFTDKKADERFAEEVARGLSQGAGYPQQLNTWGFNLLDYMEGNGEATMKDFLSRRHKK